MRDQDAESILDMVTSQWGGSIDGGARMLWKQYLLGQDADRTMKAVKRLALSEHYRPALADLAELVASFTPALPPGKECSTCNGDRFVLVATRPVKQTAWMQSKGIELPDRGGIEEYAPCPDCNPADTSFIRFDGRLVESPDPITVRERMRQ